MSEISSSRITKVLLAVGILVPLVALTAFLAFRQLPELPKTAQDPPVEDRGRVVEVGGVQRPITDVRKRNFLKVDTGTELKEFTAVKSPYGETPILDPDSTPATKAAFVGLVKDLPERVTPLIPPKKFDEASFAADPQAYLAVAEPGRVWQSAQPGPGVPALRRTSSGKVKMKQLEAVRLQVKGKPNAPVTFTSFDLGIFQNKLPSITVRADAEGVASASFTAPTGTFNRVNVLAASPLASGKVRFMIDVAVKD